MAQAKLSAVQSAAPNGKVQAAKTSFAAATGAELIQLATLLGNESTGIQDVKPVLTAISQDVIPKLKNDDCIAACKALLEKLGARRQFIAKEEAMIRRCLVDVYDAKDDFYEAVLVLKEIIYDGDCYEEKIDDWSNIAAYWFELKDATSAEGFVTKIMHISHHTEDQDKQLRIKTLYSKVKDSNRDFLTAAQGYYDALWMPAAIGD